MTSLVYRRRQMVGFMRSFIPSKDVFLVFDGTPVVCNSQNIAEAQRGYPPHTCHDPQVNLLYAVALREHRLMPVFYKRHPGSIRDVSAFANFRREMGVGAVVAICDKGFAKKSDQEEMEAAGIAYLTPRKRNNRECPRTPLEQPGLTGFQGRFHYNGRIVWYWEAPVAADAKHRCIHEALRHQEQSNLRGSDIGNETPETYLWDVRATNAGDGWQLGPVPKAAKKAFKALGLTPPDKTPDAYGQPAKRYGSKKDGAGPGLSIFVMQRRRRCRRCIVRTGNRTRCPPACDRNPVFSLPWPSCIRSPRRRTPWPGPRSRRRTARRGHR